MARISPYLNQLNKDGKTGKTWLQNYGFSQAVIAGELLPGDVLIWNYGTTSEVHEIVSVSAQMITIREKYTTGGKVQYFDRRVKQTRLIAVTSEVFNRVSGGSK